MPTIEELQVSLARERVARRLVERGVDGRTADTIAASGTYEAQANGDVVIDVGGARAIAEQPDSLDALAQHIMTTADTRSEGAQGTANAIAAHAKRFNDARTAMPNPLAWQVGRRA